MHSKKCGAGIATRSAERRMTITSKKLSPKKIPATLEQSLIKTLDSHRAEDIVSVDLRGKSDFADVMIVASGTSQRHVSALADYVVDVLKKAGFEYVPVEGKEASDWVLVDAGNIVIHLFRPEAR